MQKHKTHLKSMETPQNPNPRILCLATFLMPAHLRIPQFLCS